MTKKVCFYHSADLDGIGSAAVVAHYIRLSNSGVAKEQDLYRSIYDLEKYQLTLRGVDYHTSPDLDGIDGAHVYLVDFTFGKETMKEIASRSRLFTWIDHHGTNINNARLTDGKEESWVTDTCTCTVHDLRTSPNLLGAIELTWMVLFPKQPVPWSVSAIGAYDTWRFRKHGGDHEYVLAYQYGLRRLMLDPINPLWDRLIGGKLETLVAPYQETLKDLKDLIPTFTTSTDTVGILGAELLSSYELGSQRVIDNQILCEGQIILDAKVADNQRAAKNARPAEITIQRNGVTERYPVLTCNAAGNSDVLRSVWDAQKYSFMSLYHVTSKGWRINFFHNGNEDQVHLGDLARDFAILHGHIRADGSPKGGGRREAAGIDVDTFTEVNQILNIEYGVVYISGQRYAPQE